MFLAQSLIAYYFTRRLPQIRDWIARPHAKQQTLLYQLLQEAQYTTFGRRHNFGQLRSFADYAKAVPINDYETLKNYIQNMLDGKPNVLWPGSVRHFAKSSGTTSDKSKFIPVSNNALRDCHYKTSKDLMALYCAANPQNRLYEGKGLAMGGSQQIQQYYGKKQQAVIRVGDLSAILLSEIPFVGHYLRTPPLSVATLPDWEEKLTLTAKIALSQNITHLAGVPTWNLLLLKKILAQTGKKHIGEIWPNMELYFHGGVSFAPYRQQFEQLIPLPQMQYWQTYNASEGFFALQENPHRDDMLLMTDAGIFYEFMPLEELLSPNPQTLSLEEVEVGCQYALIISTNSGLWRYVIGDTIRFTTLNPFRIVVTGRTKHYINAFGEEVSVENTDRALTQACLQTHAKVGDYTAAPFYSDTTTINNPNYTTNKDQEEYIGGHEWLIEFEETPQDLSQFALLLDKALQELNSDYEAKRFNNMAMLPPRIMVLPKDTFYRWLKNKGKLGGQHKVPRLSNDRKTIESIIQFNKTQ